VTTDLLIVVLIGAGTYLTRLSFVAAFARSGVPGWMQAPLRYVAPAVLAAIVAPAVIAPIGAVDVTAANPRFLAGVIALLVAIRTKSVSWTIITGMAALWLLQALF
jgi:branched-subunit amino acid transport protein